MRRVFIKYNPYQVTTEITIDDQPLVGRNNRLKFPDKRLQEWVDDLPDILYEEYRTKDFEITFQGTILDFEDIATTAENAKKKGFNITLKHIPAKEVKDKEQAIADIFADIQKGPFEELKQPDVIRAFEMAKSSDFEVDVVATMSAGKSTLINALLGQKLMPAKQEACTATITEIKDNDSDRFTAKVYDKEGKLIETQPELTYEVMEQLNSNPLVSRIRAEGNIPFVTSEDVSLVLVDTPGPNNSRNQEHKDATYSMLSKSSKTVVLYIMNATQLAVDDDKNLLEYVAESMKVSGKLSRDRFIFVVNKLDDFKKSEDSIDAALKKAKEYLADKGIENPNIYPASALTALNIRTILAESDDDDDDDVYEAKGKVKKFNRNEEMHFENYAPLPASAREIISNRLAKAVESKDDKEQALIHSGVVPVEEAIRMYVLKYAKTAKIKNIVDTFIMKLESARSFEQTKEKISSKEKERDEIVCQIDAINAKLSSGKEAKRFRKKIDSINFDSEITKRANSIIKDAQEKITKQLSNPKKKISIDDAEQICTEFAKFADVLQYTVKDELKVLIDEKLEKNKNELLKQYKEKLAELQKDIPVTDIKLDPFEIMKGEILSNTDVILDSTRTEQVVVGQEIDEYIKNNDKKWYKPWTWFQEKGHWTYKDIIEEQEYVDSKKLAEKFFAPIQETLYENSASAQEYAKKEVERIKEDFALKFEQLDKVLAEKLAELKACATDKDEAQKKLDEEQRRLEWLDAIYSRVNAILEI